MANNNLQTSLTIKAGVDGVNKINELSKSIAQAGIDVGELTQKGSELAKEFSSVERQQGLIDNFVKLKKESKDTATALNEAKQATADFAKQHSEAKQKVAELENAVSQASQAIKEKAQAMKEAGKATKEQRQELREQKQALKEQEQALSKAQKEANALQKSFEQSVKHTQNLTKQQDSLNSQLQKTKTAMTEAGVSTKNLYGQKQALSAQAKEAEQSLENLTNEAKRLKSIADAKIALGIDKDDEAKRQLQEVSQAFTALKASGTLTQSELARASQLHTQKVAELERQLGKTALSFDELATHGAKIATQMGGLAVVTRQAMDFETAMAGVKKVVNGTPQQMNALTATIKDLAVELGMTAGEVANMAAMGGQLGVPIAELDRFTQMAGKMAVAFNMTADEAGNAAAKLANVFGIPILQVEKLGDAINTLGNNTAAKESEIVEAMLRIGGTAKQFGLAEEEAAALSAALIGLGKSPEVAATGINALLTKLQTAQSAGSDFQNALQSIGLSADEMADSIAKNPQIALSGFLEKLSQLDDRQRSMAAVKLFGAEYVDDINALVGSLDTYKDALGLVADKSKTAGAMEKEFKAQLATTAKQVAQAKAELANLAITLGTHLLPIISSAVGAFGDMVGAIDEIANAYPTLTKIAVIIGSGMVTVRAFNSVLALTGGLGLKAGADIAKGFLGAELAIKSADLAIDKLGKGLGVASGNTRTLAGDFVGLAKHMTTLNGLFAAVAGWEIGHTIGSWAYESSSAVRSIGDEMGRILAYGDAIFTDRTFADVNEHFKTSAESAKELTESVNDAKDVTNQLSQAQTANAQSADIQNSANASLLNSIVLLTAELDTMQANLAQMGQAGEKGTESYKQLQSNIETTTQKLSDLKSQAEQAGLGEALKSDVEKAKGAFEALGLDINEFATGIDTKAKTALSAFSEVANLAGGNVDKLARAYAAAQSAAGNNTQAQAELNGRLLEAVNGNATLAQSVKDTAKAQQEAKSATDAQAQALSDLGINMSAINAGMSDGGQKMAQSLAVGITAIKDTATSATALKTALQQAFDSSLNSAKTVGDFQAIKTAIEQAGVSAQLSAEQQKILNAGLTGGADAVKALKVATDESAKATTADAQAKDGATKATSDNTTAVNQNTEAQKANAAAAKATEDSYKGLNLETGKTGKIIELQSQSFNEGVSALMALGASAEEAKKAFLAMTKFKDGIDTTAAAYANYAQREQAAAKSIQEQVKNFENLKQEVSQVSSSLSGAELSTQSLAEAQAVLNRATAASVGGIIELDKSTLHNLKNQIEQARQEMQNLADDAKNTADSMEGELARMRGNDRRALEIENAQKLEAIEKRLEEARRRGNSAEIAQLQRQLDLQRQINSEKLRQASEKSTNASRSSGGMAVAGTGTANSQRQGGGFGMLGNGLSAGQVAGAFDDLIRQSEQRGAENFANQLMNEAKRLANR